MKSKQIQWIDDIVFSEIPNQKSGYRLFSLFWIFFI